MTFTSHGHHIPGTVDTDELPGTSRARCGGPNMCAICRRDSTTQNPYWEVKKPEPEEKAKEPLMVTKFHKRGPEAEVMFFTGGREEANDIIRWLRSHGIPASFQEEIHETIYSDYADPREIKVPATIVISQGSDGRNTTYIDVKPEWAVIHYDGDRSYVDVLPLKHFQDQFLVCQEIDPAAGIIQVEVK
ncbi:hypothetical protein PQB77_gp68 [Arthrobacter phage Correa]|uniref:Uncharacterized protein n=2 Tax=Mudcatvirus TaxID=1982088 RepID=A0A222Z8X4_9CAUD|nr:hypothetical protein PQB75_gp073 [Arthrobacter phage Tribby]YP_010666356.1 hypothetical protein PQB77_gp68 [Arthrobacter phage Correa]ASR80127.1 hypothetical protein SEA_CORREA_68 [Arthrobacter phage Correa]ASR80524.1 hypothetical protein SEA_TRIBBY_73 [Arthrobacter phage Tribby]